MAGHRQVVGRCHSDIQRQIFQAALDIGACINRRIVRQAQLGRGVQIGGIATARRDAGPGVDIEKRPVAGQGFDLPLGLVQTRAFQCDAINLERLSLGTRDGRDVGHRQPIDDNRHRQIDGVR